MATVEVQDLATVTGVQPDAVTMRHFDRILREYLGEVAARLRRRRYQARGR
jgi:hypothetical protein